MKKLLAAALLFLTGCNLGDVPPAHKGWVFEQSKFGASNGFIGPVLSPGTHDMGMENELYLLQCSQSTVRESFSSPSKNGVEFGTDVYVRFSANCDDTKSVEWILKNVQPNPGLTLAQAEEKPKAKEGEAAAVETTAQDTGSYALRTVTAAQLFHTYIRPALGKAVRDAVSRYQSDEVNLQRDAIAKEIETSFRKQLEAEKIRLVSIAQLDLSRITFPQTMQGTMERLANVKTEVELEKENAKKVDEQILTEKKQKVLAQAKAEKAGTEIEEIGKMIRSNPEYLEYLRVQNESAAIAATPAAFEGLGKGGGTVVFGSGSSPFNVMLGGKK
jgi:hypothetical protein